MRILVADDHLMFATALQFLLSSLDPGTETIPTTSAREARAFLATDSHFDLVLLDHSMPDEDGLSGLTAIRASFPALRVAILSGLTDAHLVAEARAAGAIGWIPKTMSGAPLIHALRIMAAGQPFYPPELMQTAPRPTGFSPREEEVAGLLCEGLSDKEIAARLAIQPGTVKDHVKRLLKKSGASNRTKFALLHRPMRH
jgi:DNA-binding NarL/FixJ family response regulator